MANGNDDNRPRNDDDEDVYPRGRRIPVVRQVEERTPQPAPEFRQEIAPMPTVKEAQPPPPWGSAAQQEAEAEKLHGQIWPEKAQGWKQRLGRIASIAGNVAGDIVIPHVMPQIPGTTANRIARLRGLEERIPAERREESEEPLRAAQTQEAQAAARIKGLPHELTGEGDTFTQSDAQGNVVRQWKRMVNPADPEHPYPVEVAVPGQPPPGQAAAPAPPGGAAPQTIPPVQKQPPPQPLMGPIVTGKPAGPAHLTAEQQLEQRLRDIATKPEAQRTPEENQLYAANYPAQENKLPMTANMRMSYMTQVAAALRGTQVPPEAYVLPPGATGADAKEILKAAQSAATADRLARRPSEEEAIRDRRTEGYGVNPRSGDVELGNKYQIERDWHSVFEPLGPGQIQKDKEAIIQLQDVQLNTSRYKKAINAITEDINPLAVTNMSNILHDEQLGVKLEPFGVGIDVSMLNKAVKDMSVASSWNALTDKEKDAVIGYLRAKTAVITYMRAINKAGRTTDAQLALESKNIPLPFVGSTVANKQMDSWQENIDAAGRGLPANLPGMMAPKYYKQQLERERPAAEAPAAPAAKGNQWNPLTGKRE